MHMYTCICHPKKFGPPNIKHLPTPLAAGICRYLLRTDMPTLTLNLRVRLNLFVLISISQSQVPFSQSF